MVYHHILSAASYRFRESWILVSLNTLYTWSTWLWHENRIRFFAHNIIALSPLCRLVSKHWIYKMLVRYIISSACRNQMHSLNYSYAIYGDVSSHLTHVSFEYCATIRTICNMGLCPLTLHISLLNTARIVVLYVTWGCVFSSLFWILWEYLYYMWHGLSLLPLHVYLLMIMKIFVLYVIWGCVFSSLTFLFRISCEYLYMYYMWHGLCLLTLHISLLMIVWIFVLYVTWAVSSHFTHFSFDDCENIRTICNMGLCLLIPHISLLNIVRIFVHVLYVTRAVSSHFAHFSFEYCANIHNVCDMGGVSSLYTFLFWWLWEYSYYM